MQIQDPRIYVSNNLSWFLLASSSSFFTFIPYHTLEITELGGVITIHHLDVIQASTEQAEKSNHHSDVEKRTCRYINMDLIADLQASRSNLLRGTPKNSSKTFGSTLQNKGRSKIAKSELHLHCTKSITKPVTSNYLGKCCRCGWPCRS